MIHDPRETEHSPWVGLQTPIPSEVIRLKYTSVLVSQNLNIREARACPYGCFLCVYGTEVQRCVT